MTTGPRSADLASADVVVCVDVGSTFTKAAAVDRLGTLVAQAESPTTSEVDVLEGLDAAVDDLRIDHVGDEALLVCSSAGGGLRLAVVGQERVVSVEAGRRVALSAGARIVGTWAGPMAAEQIDDLEGAAPDVVLLVGGTDGGNPDVLLHNARALGRSTLPVPVVVAGNASAAAEASHLVGRRKRVVLTADNVIPRIGTIAPDSARSVIREVFIRHVIGGKHLSRGRRLPRLVRAATPDAVLAGVETLAGVAARALSPERGDLLVVDVGGATTDVYSVLSAVVGSEEEAAARAGAVGSAPAARTVEGDLGIRWSARDLVSAAGREGLLAGLSLEDAAAIRATEPAFVPSTQAQSDDDLTLARLAATIAVRRHARPGAGARDLRQVGVAVGSGGVLRHARADQARAVVAQVLTDRGGGWALPTAPQVLVDSDYVLASVGLLTLAGQTARAEALASGLLTGSAAGEPS